MANVPGWFDATAYFNNKLASLKGIGWDSLQLKAAFTNAGYNADSAESLYAHFTDYGNNEGMSPNKLFDADQYLYNKAASFYSDAWQVNDPAVTPAMIESMRIAMGQSGMTPWDHYQEFGAKEGVNPSADFDTDKYIKAKVDKMNADKYSGKSDWTYTEVMSAISKDGMTPLTHYYLYGQNENLGYTPGAENSATGITQYLTEFRDTLYGTVANDQFHGLVAGDLNDGDYIDGGLGYDTVKAVVGEKSGQAGSVGNIASQPTMVNVEKVVFQAQLTAKNTEGNVSGNVHIDAGKIQGKIHNNLNPDFEFMGKDQGLQYLGNDDSRETLVVENVRSYTTDMTIGWFNADPNGQLGTTDYEVYFDSQYLKSGSQSTSGTLQIKLMDIMANSDTGKPLLNNPFNVFKFTYTPSGGTAQKIELEFKDAAQYTGDAANYESLLLAFQAALKESGLDSSITAELGTIFNSTYVDDNGVTWSGQGQHIVLSSSSGTVTSASWASTGDVPGDGVYETRVSSGTSETCPLITTNVELDNVGHVQWTDAYENCLPDEAIFGSESGTLLIGAHDNRAGIERFDVVVDRGSWITELKSTNNTLRAVTVKKGDVNGDGESGNLQWQANDTNVGELFIGGSKESDSGTMADWTVKPALLKTNGLTDVKYFDATGYEGHINLGASLTDKAYNKYMADVDGLNTVHQGFAPGGNFTYNLGANDDILNMEVNLGLAADIEFGLDINAGTGDDFINFNFTDKNTLAYTYPSATLRNYVQDSAKLRNVTIDGGEGKDTIWSWGAGAVTVKGGTGNDRIYVGQDHNASVAAGNDPAEYLKANNAIWVFNTDPAHKWVNITTDGVPQADENNFLATDDWADFTNAGSANSGAAVYVQVNFKGFTYSVQIEGATVGADGAITYTSTAGISTRAINNAIIKTITGNEVLDATLVAKEGSGYGLIIESKIDGKMTLDDLNISFFVSKDNGTTKGYVDNITDEYATQFGMGTEDSKLGDFATINQYTPGQVETFESFKLDLSSLLSKVSIGEILTLKVAGTPYSVAIDKALMDKGMQAVLEGLKSGGTTGYLFTSDSHEGGLFSIKGFDKDVISAVAVKAATNNYNPATDKVLYSYTGDSFVTGTVAGGLPTDKAILTLNFTDQIKNIAEGDIITVKVGDTLYYATATQTMAAGTDAGYEALVKALTAANGTKLIGTAATNGVFTFTSADTATKKAVLTHNVNSASAPNVDPTATGYASDKNIANNGVLDTEIKDPVKDHVAGQAEQFETFKATFKIDEMEVGDIFSFDFKGTTYTTVITKDMIAHTAEAVKLIVTSLTAKDGSSLPLNSADYNVNPNYYPLNGTGEIEIKAKEAVNTTLKDFDVAYKDGSYVRGYETKVEEAKVNFAVEKLQAGETYTLAFTDKDGVVTKYSVAVTKDMIVTADPGRSAQNILLGLKDSAGKALFGKDGLYELKTVDADGIADVKGKVPATSMFNDMAVTEGYQGAAVNGNLTVANYHAVTGTTAEDFTLVLSGSDKVWANTAAGDIVSFDIGGRHLEIELTQPINNGANFETFVKAINTKLGGAYNVGTPIWNDSTMTGEVILTNASGAGGSNFFTTAPTISNTSYSSDGWDQNGGAKTGSLDNIPSESTPVKVTTVANVGVQEEFTIAFSNLDKMSVGDEVKVKTNFDGGDIETHSAILTKEMLAGTPEALVALVKELGLFKSDFGKYSITVDKANPYEAVIKAPEAATTADRVNIIKTIDDNFTNNTVNNNQDAVFKEYDGSNSGTYSVNRVDAGAGDDVIVLNVGSHLDETLSPVKDYLVNDTLVITGDFGNDDVFNFNTGIDRIEFNVGAKGLAGNLGAIANANTAQAIFNAGVTAVASAKSVGYMQVGSSSEYVFFTVENDATEAVTVGEIKVLGTMDLADGTVINSGDVFNV